jgi:hypothetical protein
VGTSEQMIEALKRLDWQPLLAGEDRLLIGNGHLIEFAKSLPDDDEIGRDALHLVASICSMMLRPENWEEPYLPMMSFGEQRTMLPDDLGVEELKVVEWLKDNALEPELRARSADILWLRSLPRKDAFSFAVTAVQIWSEREVAESDWFGEGESTWRRTASLAARLNMLDSLKVVESKLLAAAEAGANPVFIGRVAHLLRDFGMARSEVDRVVTMLATAAEKADDGHVRRQLLLDQSQWVRANDEAGAWALVEAVADSWIQEAETRRGGPDGSNMVAGSFFENALQELRRVPRKFRSAHADELLARLPRMIREAGEAGLDEMHAIASDPIDLTEAVRDVQQRVAGKSAIDALAVLSAISPFASVTGDRKVAEDTVKGSIAGLFNSATFASDGRKIHTSGADEERPDGIPSKIWQRMMTHYGFRVQVLVVGQIRPALEIMTNEHRLRLADFDAIVQGSGLVPPQSRYLYALGLSMGFNGEFAAALHLLIPQIESIVRYHLREAGVDTGRIDRDSAEMEAGLSTLMKSPVADEVFGEDLAYELRALLCGPLGPNLRNRTAHGLVYASEAEGEHGEYLWWFALKLVYQPFYNRLREEPADRTEAAQPEPEPDSD